VRCGGQTSLRPFKLRLFQLSDTPSSGVHLTTHKIALALAPAIALTFALTLASVLSIALLSAFSLARQRALALTPALALAHTFHLDKVSGSWDLPFRNFCPPSNLGNFRATVGGRRSFHAAALAPGGFAHQISFANWFRGYKPHETQRPLGSDCASETRYRATPFIFPLSTVPFRPLRARKGAQSWSAR
jgi:hypothetical protein